MEAIDCKTKGGDDDGDRRSAKGSKSRKGSPERRPKAIKYIPDEVQEELEVAGPLIRREYNRGYDVLGSRFAMGDVTTQNQLQAQIIALQQTVITTLQQSLYRPESLTKAEVFKLLDSVDTARNGSIDALHSQYQRMIQEAPVKRPALPSSAPSEDGSPLFCQYAINLQSEQTSLQPFFQTGDNRCPRCNVVIPIQSNRAWKIVKDVEVSRGPAERETNDEGEVEIVEQIVMEERPFHVSNRFIVKCHRSNQEFGCALCNKFRKVDTVWESPKSLVSHLQRFHDLVELLKDADIKEVV
ncbi:hypothetical protein LTS18_008062 [Coniosporium uncinatum]|uniref:Uncharacterized protein n=1 Tax=Coniosporium uncinatum TaxID=93489 RepID=A0ACC3DNZ2_9PEZI|nr:hypothetical protein LTS18_008062 [Coniosporium uncinatum]